jgi:hypothetical protein
MSVYPQRIHQITEFYDDKYALTRKRDSFVYVTETGAIEGWRMPFPGGPDRLFPTGHIGGIEVHSATPMWQGQDLRAEMCQWTAGKCYHDGSSLAFADIELYFDMPREMFSFLEGWAMTVDWGLGDERRRPTG